MISFEAKRPIASCTAMAEIVEPPVLSRSGISPGDRLFLTGPIGWGNAVAFSNLAMRPQAPEAADALDQGYRPHARITAGCFLREWADACIDTSDGALFALDLMATLNGVGFEFAYSDSLFHPAALQVAGAARVNPWLFFAAQNGEFELLFSIAPGRVADFQKTARARGLTFSEVGQVVEKEGVSLRLPRGLRRLEMERIRNLLQDGIAPAQYIAAMLDFAKSHGIGSG